MLHAHAHGRHHRAAAAGVLHPAAHRRGDRRPHRHAHAGPVRHATPARARWDGEMDVTDARATCRTPRRSDRMPDAARHRQVHRRGRSAAAGRRRSGGGRRRRAARTRHFPPGRPRPRTAARRSCSKPAELIDERARRVRRAHRARSGQGVEARGRRGRPQRRDVHVCRRGGQAHPRRDGADGRVGLRREPRRLLPARAARASSSAITPFNFPLNLVAHKVGPALAAGNTVVLKPAEETPLTAVLMADCLREAGLPDGVLRARARRRARSPARRW